MTMTKWQRRRLWSTAVENLLDLVDGQKEFSAKILLPGLVPAEMQQTNAASSFDALRGVLDSIEDADRMIDALALTNRITVGGWVRFSQPDLIAAFSLQAFVVTDGTFDDVRLADDTQNRPGVQYFRCEHHPENLGKPFREPPVHLHVRHKGEPRLPFAGRPTENPVLSFFEFLSLNYDYDTWQQWALMVCDDHGMETEYLEIESLFAANACTGLCSPEFREKIRRIKNALWESKQRLFPWRLKDDVDQILDYWQYH